MSNEPRFTVSDESFTAVHDDPELGVHTGTQITVREVFASGSGNAYRVAFNQGDTVIEEAVLAGLVGMDADGDTRT